MLDFTRPPMRSARGASVCKGTPRGVLATSAPFTYSCKFAVAVFTATTWYHAVPSRPGFTAEDEVIARSRPWASLSATVKWPAESSVSEIRLALFFERAPLRSKM